MAVIKIIEIVGNSDKGPKEAIEAGVAEAAKTIKAIMGVDVKGVKGEVRDGKVINWRAVLKISFQIER